MPTIVILEGDGFHKGVVKVFKDVMESHNAAGIETHVWNLKELETALLGGFFG